MVSLKRLILLLIVPLTLLGAQRTPESCKTEDLEAAYAVIRQDGQEIQEYKFRIESLQRELGKIQKERDALLDKMEKNETYIQQLKSQSYPFQ